MSIFKMSVNFLKLRKNICGRLQTSIVYGARNPNDCLIHQGIYELKKKKNGRKEEKMENSHPRQNNF